MTNTRGRCGRWISVIVFLALAVSCGPRPAPSLPGGSELIVLTADPDAGADGSGVTAAVVSNRLGVVELTSPGAAAHVLSGQAPTSSTMSEAEVSRVFGEALAGLPLAPQTSVLYFRFQSDQLTPESEALVPSVLAAVVSRPAPEVLIVGHTDTTGDPQSNFELGLSRANAVRALLVAAGLEPSLAEVTSFGESVPLVATADNTAEPRNRRVEITVR